MSNTNWGDFFASSTQPNIPKKPKSGSVEELASATPNEAEVIRSVMERTETQRQIDLHNQQIQDLSKVNEFMLQNLPALKAKVNGIKKIISSNPDKFNMSMMCGEERISLGEKLEMMDYYLDEIVKTFDTNRGLKETTNYISDRSIGHYTETLERIKDRFFSFKQAFTNVSNSENSQNLNTNHRPNPFLDIDESPQDSLIYESLNYLAKFVNNMVDLPPKIILE